MPINFEDRYSQINHSSKGDCRPSLKPKKRDGTELVDTGKYDASSVDTARISPTLLEMRNLEREEAALVKDMDMSKFSTNNYQKNQKTSVQLPPLKKVPTHGQYLSPQKSSKSKSFKNGPTQSQIPFYQHGQKVKGNYNNKYLVFIYIFLLIHYLITKTKWLNNSIFCFFVFLIIDIIFNGSGCRFFDRTKILSYWSLIRH